MYVSQVPALRWDYYGITLSSQARSMLTPEKTRGLTTALPLQFFAKALSFPVLPAFNLLQKSCSHSKLMVR